MYLKTSFLSLAVLFCSISIAFGQADPGCPLMMLSKSILKVNEKAILDVVIGNFSNFSSSGKDVTPNDVRFTIVIPPELIISDPINSSEIPFAVSISSSKNVNGTVLLVTVPQGIPKGVFGTLIIPVKGYKESEENLTYARTLVEYNLSDNPSGNLSPGNDRFYLPVYVGNSLPVTLISFDAVKTDGDSQSSGVRLNWATSEESNSEKFDVEHSTNGKEWKLIGSIASAHQSTIPRDYEFIHQSPVNGNNYYRLKMVDYNQTFTYSNLRNIGFNYSDALVFPNPAADVLSFGVSDSRTVKNVELLNMSGKQVYKADSIRPINVGNMLGGTYVVRITKIDGTTVNQRVVIAK